MSNTALHTDKAPAAIGPYSQGIQAGNTIYVSGQIPIDPATGEFAGQDIKTQTRQSLTNISNILAAAGASMADVVKTTVLLKDVYKRQALCCKRGKKKRTAGAIGPGCFLVGWTGRKKCLQGGGV